MGLYFIIISICSIIVQVHNDDDMVLDFKEVSIPTKVLIIGVFAWFSILIFTNNFFKIPITSDSFLLFLDDIWILISVVLMLGWILLENIMKRPLRIVKSKKGHKYLNYLGRIILIVVSIIYIMMGFF